MDSDGVIFGFSLGFSTAELVVHSLQLIAGLTAAVIVYTKAVRNRNRAIRKARLHTIGDFPDGKMGKVIGRVAPIDQPLRAPLTGRPCAYYKIRVDEGKGAETRIIIEEKNGVDFFIADDSGSAEVSLSGAIVQPAVTATQPAQGSFTTAQSEILHKYCQSLDPARLLTFHESVIAPGDEVVVLGHGTRRPTNDPSQVSDYRHLPTRLVLGGTRRQPLIVNDSPELIALCRARAPLG